MPRKIVSIGILLAMISVALGAFGAHALKSIVSQDHVALFETGVRYQFLHAFALITLSLYAGLNKLGHNHPGQIKEGQNNDDTAFSKGYTWAANFFIAGVFLFSGSLYFLTFRDFFPSPMIALIGPITPLGGICFIAGWMTWFKVVVSDKVDK